MNATTLRIYKHLSEHKGWCSGSQIGEILGISRGAVGKQIALLRERGCAIEALSNRGYRLNAIPNTPEAFVVDPLLNTRIIGRNLIFRETTDSTNSDAATLAHAGAPDGTVVVAAHQTAGRGRFQRRWHAQPGQNLTFSLLLRPAIEPARISQLPILTAAALLPVLDPCLENTPTRLAIKWPNDILAGDRKLAGILCDCECEADLTHHVILGMGINVNSRCFPEPLCRTATSLALETGRETPLAPLLAAILNHFEPLYRDWCAVGDLTPFLPILNTRSQLLGRTVRIQTVTGTLHGRLTRIQPNGQLEIDTPDGRTSVHAGEVSLNGER